MGKRTFSPLDKGPLIVVQYDFGTHFHLVARSSADDVDIHVPAVVDLQMRW